MSHKLLLCATIVLCAGQANAQKMYRCGATYSQTPCAADAKEIDMRGAAVSAGDTSTKKLPDNASEQTKARSLELCKTAVVGILKDPESAKFQNVARSNSLERRLPALNGPLVKTAGFNGYVNARNSFGGYTGNKLFFCSLDYETETRVLDVAID